MTGCGNDPRTQLTDGDHTEVERFAAHLAESRAVQPRVVCICGSMRFQAQMAEAAADESLAGWIVLMPHVNMATGAALLANPDESKRDLDRLHRAKIRISPGAGRGRLRGGVHYGGDRIRPVLGAARAVHAPRGQPGTGAPQCLTA